MRLSEKQRNYIDKKKGKRSEKQIAKSLGVKEDLILEYLGKKGRKKGEGEKKDLNLKRRIEKFVFVSFFRKNWLFFLWFLGLVGVCYMNGLANEFVSDDIGAIVQNEGIGDLKVIFSSPLSSFRSFQQLVFFLVYHLFGKSAMAFRLVNVSFHFGVVSLLFVLVCLLVEKRVAVLAASLVAIHPLMTESVTWVTGVGHVMYTFFLLLALFLYVLGTEKMKYFYWSFLAMFLAFSVSEKAVIYPLILLLLVACFGLGKKEIKKLFIAFIPAIVMGLVFLSMLSDRLNWLGSEHYHSGEMANPLAVVIVAVSSYLGLMVWPDKLTLYHSELTFGTVKFVGLILVFLIFLSGTVYLWIKKREWSFWPMAFFVSLLPVMTPFGVSWLVAERYVYFGATMMMVLVAIGLDKFLRSKKWDGVAVVFLVLLGLGLTVRTVVRNGDWKNQDTLWLSAARTSPSSHQNHNNLGDYYARTGDYENAIREFSWAIELKPNYGDAIHNRANIYVLVGEVDEAIKEYYKAIEINPNLWQSYQKLAAVYFELEEWDQSVGTINRAIEISPENLTLHFNKGVILAQAGRYGEARTELELVLQYNPTDEKVKRMLLDLPSN